MSLKMTPPTFLNDITFLLYKNVNRIYAKLDIFYFDDKYLDNG